MKKQILKRASRFTINHLLVIVLFLLIGVQVYVSNKVATSGVLLSELEQKATTIEEENRILLSSNVDYMSLNQLSIKARELGYVEPQEIINLESQSQLALR